jgi:hypothetical protein
VWWFPEQNMLKSKKARWIFIALFFVRENCSRVRIEALEDTLSDRVPCLQSLNAMT